MIEPSKQGEKRVLNAILYKLGVKRTPILLQLMRGGYLASFQISWLSLRYRCGRELYLS